MSALLLQRQRAPEMEGALAYPRKNGEPVFDAPWQSRAFGMVVQLHTSGLYEWDAFKRRLIEEIAAGPCASAPPDSAEHYYHQWVEAFWRLLIEMKILDEEEMKERVCEFRIGARQDIY